MNYWNDDKRESFEIDQILYAEYMSDLFTVTVTESSGFIDINFSLDSEKLEYIKERYLGKNLLFTDNHDWETGKIISAYRSQFHIENAFRQMKDTTFFEVRPIYHWTDQKIEVHILDSDSSLVIPGQQFKAIISKIS